MTRRRTRGTIRDDLFARLEPDPETPPQPSGERRPAVPDLTDAEIDEMLELFDQTEARLQRRIIARFVRDRTILMDAVMQVLTSGVVLPDPVRAVLRDALRQVDGKTPKPCQGCGGPGPLAGTHCDSCCAMDAAAGTRVCGHEGCSLPLGHEGAHQFAERPRRGRKGGGRGPR